MLAQYALDAIATDRAFVHLARHRQAQPRRLIVIQQMQGQMWIGTAPSALEHAVELGLGAHARRTRKLEAGFRPESPCQGIRCRR